MEAPWTKKGWIKKYLIGIMMASETTKILNISQARVKKDFIIVYFKAFSG